MDNNNLIKVLIVDDSAVARNLLTKILSSFPDISVIATALDPFVAAKKIVELKPDVLTLDFEMPRMNGITFLNKLMKTKPIPVIMVSSYTKKSAEITLKALENGAIDYILKPDLYENIGLKAFGDELAAKIRAAADSEISNLHKTTENYEILQNRDILKSKSNKISDFIIAIGASTGGTEAITRILTKLPNSLPGIVVSQHMPPLFTRTFAERMDKISMVSVKEAQDGDVIYDGCVYIAPGGRQMKVKHKVTNFYIEISDEPSDSPYKPSVDVLFDSVAKYCKNSSIGILLTGMGFDGAKGLLNMLYKGAVTIAQDKKSSVIFGMPRAAIEIGAAKAVIGLDQIPNYLIAYKYPV